MKMNAKRMTTNAVLIALYVVLSFVSLNFFDRRERPRFKFCGQFATAAAVSARTAPMMRTDINAVFSAIAAHADG